MNKTYTLSEDELRGEIYQRMLRLMWKNRGGRQSVAAAIGLFGGLLSIVLGVLVWAVVGLFAPAGALGTFLDVAGTILFVLPLPLMALGACCLDRLEKKAPPLPLPAAPRPDTPRRVVRQAHPAGRRVMHTLELSPDSVQPLAAVRSGLSRPRAAGDLQRADDGRARTRQGLR